jgi:hypothetical protein
VALFLEHWQWTLGAAVALTSILVYRYVLKKAEDYTLRVKKELEEYVKQSTPTPMPLPIPPRNPSDSATLSDEKQAIWQGIHDHPRSHYQQVDFLVGQLAEARIAANFQDAYVTIFGSQHTFLRRLNTQTGSGSMSRAASQTFLQELAATNVSVAEANYDFNRWLAFLVSRGFVNIGVDSISITNTGQDFLVWTMRRQLPDRTHEGV